MDDDKNKSTELTERNAAGENSNGNTDIEGEPKKIPYPKSIAFIISNEFCERFNYYGMRTILVLYLTRKLLYDDDLATIVYHTFATLVYFLSVLGAILSDSWLGKFYTILYLSIVYVIGSTLMSLGAIPTLNMPASEITILGLALIAIGSGGIKPCVAAFGGDQFKMPEQAKQMAWFFSLFYFSINAGSLISTSITPIFREDVNCFGDDDCYSLAFGVPAVLMLTSIVIFVLGKFLYKITPPSGNMVVMVSKCIGNAISTKYREQKTMPRSHWLEYAEPIYGRKLVQEVKILLNVLVLYLPLPLFWSLFDQQGSRWTFQATRMNGDLGFYEIKPDQMQVVNPLLILIFIPLYDVVFYPLLSKIGIRRPLQKLALGGILAGVAFLSSGIVELELEKTYPRMPHAGESQFRLYNTMQCDYNVQTTIPEHQTFLVKSLEAYQQEIPVPEGTNVSYSYTMTPASGSGNGCTQLTGSVVLASGEANSFYMFENVITPFIDDPMKSSTGDPRIRMLSNVQGFQTIRILDLKREGFERFDGNSTFIKPFQIIASDLEVYVNNIKAGEFSLRQGVVAAVLIVQTSPTTYSLNTVDITAPNEMNMLWLLPQYIIMTLGEVTYSVTGLAFSYAQAPVSMKSVLQSCWLLTVAFGNLIDIIVVGAKFFDSQAMEFFLFAGLMFLDMIVFMILAYRYKSIEQVPEEEQHLMGTSATDDGTTVQKRTSSSGLDNPTFTKDSNN